MKLSAHASQILEGLAQVAHSRLEEAFTVPPAIYADPEVANLELENIFKTDWLCPGLAAGCLLTFILSLGYYITPALVGGPSDNMIAGFIDRP